MFGACKNQLGRHALVTALSVAVIAIDGSATLARNTDGWPVEGKLLGEFGTPITRNPKRERDRLCDGGRLAANLPSGLTTRPKALRSSL